MMGMMIETVVMAFVIGGIIGAISALHLSAGKNRVPVKIDNDHPQRGRRIR